MTAERHGEAPANDDAAKREARRQRRLASRARLRAIRKQEADEARARRYGAAAQRLAAEKPLKDTTRKVAKRY